MKCACFAEVSAAKQLVGGKLTRNRSQIYRRKLSLASSAAGGGREDLEILPNVELSGCRGEGGQPPISMNPSGPQEKKEQQSFLAAHPQKISQSM